MISAARKCKKSHVAMRFAFWFNFTVPTENNQQWADSVCWTISVVHTNLFLLATSLLGINNNSLLQILYSIV